MEIFIFRPQGVCSREMRIAHENGRIVDFQVIGGCSGNLQGIGALVKGMPFEEVVAKLKGIRCGAKSTSCPDQLAIAISELLQKKA